MSCTWNETIILLEKKETKQSWHKLQIWILITSQKTKNYKSRYKYELTQTSRELVQNYISSFHIDREWLSEIIEYIPYLVFENLT
jgi:hypothetical protein